MIHVSIDQNGDKVADFDCHCMLMSYDHGGEIKSMVSSEIDEPEYVVPLLGCSSASACVQFLGEMQAEQSTEITEEEKDKIEQIMDRINNSNAMPDDVKSRMTELHSKPENQ